jgi:hypothetical protein
MRGSVSPRWSLHGQGVQLHSDEIVLVRFFAVAIRQYVTFPVEKRRGSKFLHRADGNPMTAERNSEEVAKAAKVAFEASQLLEATERIKALHSIREELEARKTEIFEANKQDLQVSF